MICHGVQGHYVTRIYNFFASFAVVWSVKGRPKITKAHPAIQTLIYPLVKTEQKQILFVMEYKGIMLLGSIIFSLLLLLFGR